MMNNSSVQKEDVKLDDKSSYTFSTLHRYEEDDKESSSSCSDETTQSFSCTEEEESKTSMLGISLEEAQNYLSFLHPNRYNDSNSRWKHINQLANHNDYETMFQRIHSNSKIYNKEETTKTKTSSNILSNHENYYWANPSAFVFSTATYLPADDSDIATPTPLFPNTINKNPEPINTTEIEQKKHDKQENKSKYENVEKQAECQKGLSNAKVVDLDDKNKNHNHSENTRDVYNDDCISQNESEKETSSFKFVFKSLSLSSSSSSSSSSQDSEDDNGSHDECQKEMEAVQESTNKLTSKQQNLGNSPIQNQSNLPTKKKQRTLKKICFDNDDEYCDDNTTAMTNIPPNGVQSTRNGMWQSTHKIHSKRKRKEQQRLFQASKTIKTSPPPHTHTNSHNTPTSHLDPTISSSKPSSSYNNKSKNCLLNQKKCLKNNREKYKLDEDTCIQTRFHEKNVIFPETIKRTTAITTNDNSSSSNSSEEDKEEEEGIILSKQYDIASDEEQNQPMNNTKRIQRQQQQAQYAMNKKNNDSSDDEIVDDDDSFDNDTTTQPNTVLSLTPCLSLQPSSTATQQPGSGCNIMPQQVQQRRKRPHLKRLKQLSQNRSNENQVANTDHHRRHTIANSTPSNKFKNPFQPTVRKRNKQLSQQSITNMFLTKRK